MEQNILFFDIDGTLVSFKDGSEEILESTKAAIQRTREKGNLVYLCTGRSKAEIYDFIMDIGIDGVIGAGGGYVEIDKDMLYHKKVSPEAVKHLVDYFSANQFDYYLESNGGLYASPYLIPRLERMLFGDFENDAQAKARREKGSPFIDALKLTDNMYREDINKVCFLEHESISFEEIVKEFSQEFTLIQGTVPAFGRNSGELTVPHVNKATAIEQLLKHLSIDRKNTYAFGDGLNDIDMFQCCAVGIAMGNAKEELKAIADYVTDSAGEDGIYNIMKKLDLC